MAELNAVERDVLVAIATCATAVWASADVAALLGVSSTSAEAALWALTAEDLAEEIPPGPQERYAGRWSVFRATPYGIRFGHLLAHEAAS